MKTMPIRVSPAFCADCGVSAYLMVAFLSLPRDYHDDDDAPPP